MTVSSQMAIEWPPEEAETGIEWPFGAGEHRPKTTVHCNGCDEWFAPELYWVMRMKTAQIRDGNPVACPDCWPLLTAACQRNIIAWIPEHTGARL